MKGCFAGVPVTWGRRAREFGMGSEGSRTVQDGRPLGEAVLGRALARQGVLVSCRVVGGV